MIRTARAVITLAQLHNAGACPEACAEFERRFGDSTTVTVAKARKVAAAFDWDWAASRLLSAAAMTTYNTARAGPRATYIAAMYVAARAGPRATYIAATAGAWAIFNAARATAWAECYIADQVRA